MNERDYPVTVTSPTKTNGYLRSAVEPSWVKEHSRLPGIKSIRTQIENMLLFLRADALQPDASERAETMLTIFQDVSDALNHPRIMWSDDDIEDEIMSLIEWRMERFTRKFQDTMPTSEDRMRADAWTAISHILLALIKIDEIEEAS